MTEEIYSFSRITPSCLYAWKRTYIDGDRGGNNAFSEYGTIAHEIFEKYSNQEIFDFEMSELFVEKFNKMTNEFPPNEYVDLKERYFNDGLRYFKNFEGFPDKTLEVEQEYIFEIDGIKFIGYPDRIGQDSNGDISIWDYKSSKPYIGDDLKEKIKQLYLYSIICKEKYGKYPKYLRFVHFRQNKIVTILFNEQELENTKKWAVKQVQMLRELKEFPPNLENKFYCNYICNHRETCEYKVMEVTH